MTQEQADLINVLTEVEDQIDELWDYHPENPRHIDVVERFETLQKLATVIQGQIAELGDDREDLI